MMHPSLVLLVMGNLWASQVGVKMPVMMMVLVHGVVGNDLC